MKHETRNLLIKIGIVIFIIVLFMWPSGLTKRPDINNRIMVSSLGIDVDEKSDGLKVSAQIIVPKQGDQGSQKLIYATGKSLGEAVENMNIKTGKAVELGHCGLIILGKKFIEGDPVPTLEYLVSSGEVNPEITIVSPKEGTADELLQKASTFSEIDSMGLSSFISYAHYGVHMVRVSLLKFLNLTNSKSKVAYIPALQTESEQEGGSGGKNSSQESGGGQSGGSGGGQSEGGQSGGGKGGESGGSGGNSGESGGGDGGQEKSELDKSDIVFIFKSGKLLGTIGEAEFKGLNWLDKKVSIGSVFLRNIDIFGNNIPEIPLTMKSKNLSTSAKFEDDGRKILKIKLQMKLEIEDRRYMNILRYEQGFESDKLYKRLSEHVEEYVVKQIESCRNKATELDCDIMGLNNKFYRTSVSKFESEPDKDNLFKNVEFQYDFKIEIV